MQFTAINRNLCDLVYKDIIMLQNLTSVLLIFYLKLVNVATACLRPDCAIAL